MLHSLVYIVLALVFLLPARQTWEDIRDQSKVLILFDVSTSLTDVRDDLPEEGRPYASLPTRQDKVLSLLENKQLAFLNGLAAKNPLTV